MTHERATRILTSLYVVCIAVRVVGSVGVLLLASGWLGPWASMGLLGWVAFAPVLRTASGERCFLRSSRRCRSPNDAERPVVAALSAGLCARCGLSAVRIVWYIRRGDDDINAYAAGRRSIALTEGLFRALTVGEIDVDEVVAILAHEVGHLLDPTSQHGLIIAWLTGPWRVVQAPLIHMVRATARRVPGGQAALLALPALAVIAEVQLMVTRDWVPLVGIAGLAVAIGITPVVDAAVSRRAELAADDYAADVGAAAHLALVLARSTNAPDGRVAKLYARHPPVSLRIQRLIAPRW